MKHYILIFILLILSGKLYAQSEIFGYYITNSNDTINAQIKVKKGAFGQITNDFNNEIELIEKGADLKRFTPTEIKGYVFTFDNVQYRFLSKPTKKGTNKFLVPIVIGSKTCLYQYGNNTKGNGNAMDSNQVFYTFEKPDGTYLFLNNILNKKFRTELKEFYKDSDEAQLLIDKKLKYWLELQQDLKDILSAINKS